MKKFVEWLKEQHPDYLFEAMSRRGFLGAASASLAGMLGLTGKAEAQPNQNRPEVRVQPLTETEPNHTDVWMAFDSTGDIVENRQIAVRVLDNQVQRSLHRRVETFLGNRRDVQYRFQLVDPATQRPITAQNIRNYLRYQQTPRGGNDTAAGRPVELRAEYQISYIGPDGRMINNITTWLANNPAPAGAPAPGDVSPPTPPAGAPVPTDVPGYRRPVPSPFRPQ